MKSVALLLPGGIFLLARMARTKAKARAGLATKRTIAGKSKAPPAPPWWVPMNALMDMSVSLWNVEARGACGILSYAFGKLQHQQVLGNVMVHWVQRVEE